MDDLTDLSAWRDALFQAGTQVASAAANLLPRALAALLLLALGWLVARAVELATSRGLRLLGVDRAANQLRVTDVMERAGVSRPPSDVASRLVFWLLLLTFLLSGIRMLGFTAVTATLDRLVAYFPSIAGAALVLLVGFMVARMVGSLAASASAAAGLSNAHRAGFFVQALIAAVVSVVAIEQLGVETNILVLPLTALVGAAALTAGLAFALGASPIITHILAGHFLKQTLPRESFIEVAGERGMVERVGPTETVLRNGERSWSVPNGRLIGEVVIR